MGNNSCSNCLHHDICRIAEMMLKFAPHLTDKFNQFARELRKFLGDNCPYYMAEEKEDEKHLDVN